MGARRACHSLELSATTDIKQSRMTSGGCGRSFIDWFANYDPDMSCWRTSQACLLEDLDRFSETWPRAGMTRNGRAYERRPLVRRRIATEYSLWPTPVASDAKRVKEFSMAVLTADYIKRRGGAYLAGALAAEFSCAQTATFTEWLMGYPKNWTDCTPSAMPSSRRSRSGSRGGY